MMTSRAKDGADWMKTLLKNSFVTRATQAEGLCHDQESTPCSSCGTGIQPVQRVFQQRLKSAMLLVTAGEAALKAAKAKDVDRLSQIGDGPVYTSCDTCHKQYMKKE